MQDVEPRKTVNSVWLGRDNDMSRVARIGWQMSSELNIRREVRPALPGRSEYTVKMTKILERVRAETVKFEQIEDELLDTLWELDAKLQAGAIAMESYRNDKGNWWTEIIRKIIQRAADVEVKPASITGTSETHNVDLVLIRASVPMVCVEVKAQGNPGYLLRKETKPERRIQSDIDKRLKEVKYTSVDLKRKYGRSGGDKILSLDKEQDWIEWKDNAQPKFYAIWLGRRATGESVELLLRKMREAMKYLNGIGAFMYEAREDSRGYRQIDVFKAEFPISVAVEKIVADIKSAATGQALLS